MRRFKTSVLPLMQSALAGFTRLHPVKADEPATWADAGLAASCMVRKKTARCVLLATAVLLQFDNYARPSELFRLNRSMLTPPAVRKVGRVHGEGASCHIIWARSE